MGLFSTLTSSSGGEEETVAVSSSSAAVPTLVQLYSSTPIQLDQHGQPGNKVSGYSTLTYQAIPVGNSGSTSSSAAPDLGVWNCKVTPSTSPLVDQLLLKLKAPHKQVFVLTVDLSSSQVNEVEPELSLLQATLVRFLIASSSYASGEEGDENKKNPRKTATTSLAQLQQVQFGLAVDDETKDKKEAKNVINEADDQIQICLQLCAVLPPLDDSNAETAYRTKQARALVVYHLRKYATAIGASLVFVRPPPSSDNKGSSGEPTTAGAEASSSSESAAAGGAVQEEQTTVDYNQLAELWRDLAKDVEVWNKSSMNDNNGTTTAPEGASSKEEQEAAIMTPVYGPGRQQEDLIESVLLRNAHCPGVWDASKDSLWVALPATAATPEGAQSSSSPGGVGDEGWLRQLRDSIASASEPAPPATPAKDGDDANNQDDNDGTTPKKDAAVSSFFESLLKDP